MIKRGGLSGFAIGDHEIPIFDEDQVAAAKRKKKVPAKTRAKKKPNKGARASKKTKRKARKK